LLGLLVGEMNAPTPGRSLTQHRKIACSFRDQALFKVFSIALASLKHLAPANNNSSNMNSSSSSNSNSNSGGIMSTQEGQQTKLNEAAVQLALACLSFDFVGTCLDESSEDVGTIQIPAAWRPAVEDPSTTSLFFEFYATSSAPLSSIVLECLVRLASVRRSLFASEGERSKFLERLVNGSRDILKQQRGLGEHSNYHEFCRLLGRLKTNYQLSELVGLAAYPEWIALVAEFTVNSLKSWQWTSGSVYYLLGLWSRLVSSMPYLKGDAPSHLDVYVPKITRSYMESRLQSVPAVVAAGGGAEDPLENEEEMQGQLDSLPHLVRFQYLANAEYLMNLADPILAAYTNYNTAAAGSNAALVGMNGNGNGSCDNNVEILEGQLTWLVHIVGAVLKGRTSGTGGGDIGEQTDSELVTRVFSLLRVLDTGAHNTRYGERSRQRLDLALLSFFQNFRKAYVGEQVMHTSRVYQRLKEKLGLGDHLAIMAVMLGKIAINLKVYGGCDDVVDATLTLFQDLAAGYMSGKLLLKLEAVAYLLAHHSTEYYPFVSHPANRRARTVYYQTLARLLFMEDPPLSKFKSFMAPLQHILVGLGAAQAAGGPAALRAAAPAETVAGLFRDLRGIASASNNRRTYCTLFDWLYPAHFPVILGCLEGWGDTPQVTGPILKFMREFVINKTQRLTFDSSSPNGILLFREVSKVLVLYGRNILGGGLGGGGGGSGIALSNNNQNGSGGDPYGTRYKGIWLCMSILTRALGGNYVNFGVFDLYGDPALKDALDVVLQMALSIPLHDILAYRKVGKAYYGLVDVLCSSQTKSIAGRDTATFSFIMDSLDAGLKSLDVTISSQCAAAADNLAGYYFKHMPGSDNPTPAADAIADHLRARPNLLTQLLSTLFEIVLFEDCTNQWSLSRPMLSLILINEQVYGELKRRLIASQPQERHQHLAGCLDKLMDGVQRSLDPKNRDKFTQNITLVRHEYKTFRI
jgi:exportin-7